MSIQEYIPGSISRFFDDINTIYHTDPKHRATHSATKHLAKVAARITLVAISLIIIAGLTVLFAPPPLLLRILILILFTYTKNSPSHSLLIAVQSIARLCISPLTTLGRIGTCFAVVMGSRAYNNLDTDTKTEEKLPTVLTENFAQLFTDYMPYARA